MRGKLRILGVVATMGALCAGVALAASSAPGVLTGTAFPVLQNEAILHGYVNPHGSDTTYYFQWGLTTGYGSTGTSASAGSGTKATAVNYTAGGLMPDTTYHFRLVASNSGGTTLGADRTFTTPAAAPAATTDPAENISTKGATLVGTINPEDSATTWYFEWGSSSNYGQQTAAQTLPAGTSPQKVTWSLAGLLAPGTIYHYKLVARHTLLSSDGSDESFLTYPSPRPVPALSAKTTPKRDRRQPYVFTTSGKVKGPSWMPAQYACAGTVTIRFFRGSHQVAYRRARVRSSCKFSTRTVLRRIPGRHSGTKPVRLRVVVRFVATPYLAANRASAERVTLG